jgi:hypothetical protein
MDGSPNRLAEFSPASRQADAFTSRRAAGSLSLVYNAVCWRSGAILSASGGFPLSLSLKA